MREEKEKDKRMKKKKKSTPNINKPQDVNMKGKNIGFSFIRQTRQLFSSTQN